MHKLIRITTIPLSLEKLLEGQLTYMNKYYDVTAVSAEKERLEKFGRENGVKTFWVEMTRAITPAYDMKAVWKLYKFFKEEKPAIVHTHTPKAGITGMLAARLAGVPIRLHTVAGLPLLETTGIKRSLLNKVEKATYALATRIYPNSFGLKEIIKKEGFATEGKMKILGKGSSNGIDTQHFDPALYGETERLQIRKDIRIPEEDIVFLFIGRLVSEKGINELVKAFEELNVNYPRTSLLLVGPFEKDLDPLLPSTIIKIKEHQKIFTTGYQQDVRPFLAASNVLTFPSYREGFPNVVMQAGAMGLPSIVSNINGCNEIIVSKKNGIIVPVKNEKFLLEAMETCTKEPDLRKKMSENSRGEITGNYEREQFWQLLKAEYDSLFGEQYSNEH